MRSPRLPVAGLLRLARDRPVAMLSSYCLACERPYPETALAAKLHPRCPFCGKSETFQHRTLADPSVAP